MRRMFVIRDTHKYGKGVYALRDIAPGEVIHILEGTTVSARELVERINAGLENVNDPLQVGMRTYIDLDALSRTFNHSCEPNAALRKRSELFALHPIAKGKEITYDYSLTIAPTEWSMRCACGSSRCRGVLGDVMSIPPARRAAYTRSDAIQSYMKKLLDRIRLNGGHRIPAYEAAYLKRLNRTSGV